MLLPLDHNCQIRHNIMILTETMLQESKGRDRTKLMATMRTRSTMKILLGATSSKPRKK